ncbi:MAG TPA: GNAT family N-acetyltransferase [Pyrinomonadaceae bacterium]|nr:GNAT family N-acetyltransferase [Pyrinomonadaceae bacterium]
MPDMLVNLLKLPPPETLLKGANNGGGILVRRANAWELTQVRAFVREHFGCGWADEISVGFMNKPVSVYVATEEHRVVGFAGYECTRRAFFGPLGVVERVRGRGAGRALLVACLWGLRELGYVYGIIGGAGPAEFYERAVGATVIPDSAPGIYTDILVRDTVDD